MKTPGLAAMILIMVLTLSAAGCRSEAKDSAEPKTATVNNESPIPAPEPVAMGIDNETASDGDINFSALHNENGEIVAWLQVLRTDIDMPVLQSHYGDDFYQTHNARKEPDDLGTAYIELANVPDMCDFMTIIYGSGGTDGIFRDLYKYSDPDFFESNDRFYIYIEDNILTYTVYACEEKSSSDLLRSYDFTSEQGCNDYINDFYSARNMGRQIREEWGRGALSPYFFLTALCATDPQAPDRQFVVYGCLTNDAAGTIDRTFYDWDEEWDFDWKNAGDIPQGQTIELPDTDNLPPLP
ncbi:MAG: class B sortase [Lachnospiraceae bacterium]|nr:class B sortase [Lachnospiraceae bacterium]